MTQIDFTQPLELVADGTPVKLDDSRRDNPDAAGDYYLVREDGQNFTMAQTGEGFVDNILIVRPDGRQWVHELRDRPPVIRNRATAFWGPEIEVNGVRPTWLRSEDRVRWYGCGMTDQRWDRHASGGVKICTLQWDATITAIRLPADHFAYKAIERGFEPWGGGDSAPDDWDGGDVLRVGGAKFCGERLAQPYYVAPYENNQRWNTSPGTEHGKNFCDIIGYRKKATTLPASQSPKWDCPAEEIDWAGDLEAVRISDGFTMPVTLDYGPDAYGDYVTVECPDGSRTNREWRADGSDRCFYGEWRIRNRVAEQPAPAPAPEGYEAAGDWFAPEDDMTPVFPPGSFYQMREIGGRGYVNPCPWSADKDRTWARSALSGTAFATTPPTADGRTQSHNTEYRLLRPITVTVPVLTEADIAAADEALMEDRTDDSTATFFARRWGLFTPEPSALDRFMAAYPDADRATAEAALNWAN